jgi:hypothetical protein
MKLPLPARKTIDLEGKQIRDGVRCIGRADPSRIPEPIPLVIKWSPHPGWTTLMRIAKARFLPLQWHHAIVIFSRVKASSTAKERSLRT